MVVECSIVSLVWSLSLYRLQTTIDCWYISDCLDGLLNCLSDFQAYRHSLYSL